MKTLLLALTLVAALVFGSPAKADCGEYFTDVHFHPGYGNPHEAQVYFTTVNPQPGQIVKYTAVGLATLSESCIRPDGTVLWSQTDFASRLYSSTYQVLYNSDVPTENSAQIRSTNFPTRTGFPACNQPNVLRLDSVNWLAATLYDLTDLDEGVVCTIPAVPDGTMTVVPSGGIDEPIPVKP